MTIQRIREIVQANTKRALDKKRENAWETLTPEDRYSISREGYYKLND